jgi:hypothetical protein
MMTDAQLPTAPILPQATQPQTLFFGIPLKARSVAQNWDWTVRDFNRTLASIYNQTNPNFRILVGCHEIPELLIPTDDRLEFIQVNNPTPNLVKDPRSIYSDKIRKFRRLGERFRELRGTWFMVVDADDLISSKVVEFVLRNQHPNGFIARQGYILDQQARVMATIPDPNIFKRPFDQITGTCATLRFDEEDFGTAEADYCQSRFGRYVAYANHVELWDMSIQDGRPLIPFPFPASVYVVNTGENYSFVHGSTRRWRNEELLPALHKRKLPIDENLLNEFALSHPVWKDSV